MYLATSNLVLISGLVDNVAVMADDVGVEQVDQCIGCRVMICTQRVRFSYQQGAHRRQLLAA